MPLQKSDTALGSYSGHRIEPKGMITLPLEWKDNSHNVLFNIIETQSQSVISGKACEDIGILKRRFNQSCSLSQNAREELSLNRLNLMITICNSVSKYEYFV